ncbi:DUF721 domain-containing protein [Hydrocarboniclastica marina]|uniref:DUF721 domain-containing protein n=1 Tax=Hydrocarboniclastica marina TaxID=2259620 RepID=A0A4P7XET4_9ALTE|nr:DciA family protein [Hydrocarboniclastica marina]MAL99895.1 hypothetical protein [Alteromonadaceae bacterium]QCF25145.1 DUF721 domain-containing protein [Hydrocarboniclastica marina]|tara:strand:+ start:3554 stop:3988 length:435 start_codon:yes stop_codon:yes gene_type:complete
MAPKRPKTLDTIESDRLNQLFAAAQRRAQEETEVLACLPEQFRKKCRFGGFSNGELTLVVAHSALATQLRYQQYDILQAIRQDERFKNAWRIRTRVAPPHFLPPRQRVKRALSKKNARLLEEEAGHTKDEGLRDVLLKLARHHQ